MAHEPSYIDPYASRLEELRTAYRQSANTPLPTEMYSPEELAKRQAEHQRNLFFGQVGGISNDKAVMNVSEPMLKLAMEAQKPKYTEHGRFDETTGKFSYFPGYQEARKQDMLGKQLQQIEAASAEGQRRWDEGRQRAHEAYMLRTTLAGMKGGSDGDKGSTTYIGVDPDTNQPVYNHTKHGLIGIGPDGKAYRYQGKPPGPKNQEPPAAITGKYMENRAGLSQTDVAIEKVRANPAAVGAVAVLPEMVSQYIPTKGGKEGVDVRAAVANLGSLKIHDRSGAAVSALEMPRLRPFVPNIGTDSPETIQKKLELFKHEYQTIINEVEAGYPLSTVIQNTKRQAAGRITNAPPANPARDAINKKYGIQ